ncbi:MAG: CAP domain-containing protein [Acidimicrobiia bacterium]|nr:CAP domain-containing protein [Acidimicrobiia bacterium]
MVAPIVAAAPASAACAVYIFGRCISTGAPPTTAPPVTTPPTTAPPAAPAPPAVAPPAPAASVDPDAAATQFFDLTNGERASAGVPALEWRADVATMAVAHSVEMAQAGNIWHDSFVSEGNLKALNASSIGQNVGMGGDVASIHQAFMNSPGHRENILDPGFNQVGIGVIVAGNTVFVTEDFLHSKSAGTARPTPVPHPTVVAPPATHHTSAPRVAAATPYHVEQAVAAPAPAPAAPPVTAPAPSGVVNAVPFTPAPAVANAMPTGAIADVLDGGAGVWIALLGGLLLVGLLGGVPLLRASSTRNRPPDGGASS